MYPERLEERAALLAHHWEGAGELQAARWHARAAAWTGTSDPAASVSHWTRVRELVAELPEDAETLALGVTSRIWGLQFGWRLGMSEEDANQLYEQGEALARRGGDLRSRAALIAVYATIRAIAGRIDSGQFVKEALEALSLAEEAGDDALVVGLTSAPVFALWNAGRFEEAIKLSKRAIDLCDGRPEYGTGISIASPLAFQTMWIGVCTSHIGPLDEADRFINRAQEIARGVDDLETIAWCYEMRIWVSVLRGEPRTALADGQQCYEIAERIGDGFTRSWAYYWLAAAHGLEENWERTIELCEQSERMSQEMRTAVLGRPPRLANISQALVALGRPEEAVQYSRDALASADEQGLPSARCFGLISLARALRETRGAEAIDEIDALLRDALKQAETIGFATYLPPLLEEQAELERLRGDEESYEQTIREALKAAERVDATGHAARFAEQLELQPS